MKENIEIIEAFLNECDKNSNDEVYLKCNGITKCAIKNILFDYKRVLKENEELKSDNYELNNRMNDLLENIPVQKIQDKIEEYSKIEKEMHENKNHSNDINEIYKYSVEEDKAKYGKLVLQELLEKIKECENRVKE